MHIFEHVGYELAERKGEERFFVCKHGVFFNCAGEVAQFSTFFSCRINVCPLRPRIESIKINRNNDRERKKSHITRQTLS